MLTTILMASLTLSTGPFCWEGCNDVADVLRSLFRSESRIDPTGDCVLLSNESCRLERLYWEYMHISQPCNNLSFYNAEEFCSVM